MQTVTIADVRNMFARYQRANDAADLVPEGFHLVLTEGSKYYGNAYRVNLTGKPGPKDANGHNTWPNGSEHARPPVGDDYLGMTKREAFDTLADASAIIEGMTAR